MTILRMLRHTGSLNPGEVAGFPDDEAARLIKSKAAERVVASAPAPATVTVSADKRVEHPPTPAAGGEVVQATPIGRKR